MCRVVARRRRHRLSLSLCLKSRHRPCYGVKMRRPDFRKSRVVLRCHARSGKSNHLTSRARTRFRVSVIRLLLLMKIYHMQLQLKLVHLYNLSSLRPQYLAPIHSSTPLSLSSHQSLKLPLSYSSQVLVLATWQTAGTPSIYIQLR